MFLNHFMFLSLNLGIFLKATAKLFFMCGLKHLSLFPIEVRKVYIQPFVVESHRWLWSDHYQVYTVSKLMILLFKFCLFENFSLAIWPLWIKSRWPINTLFRFSPLMTFYWKGSKWIFFLLTRKWSPSSGKIQFYFLGEEKAWNMRMMEET